MIAVRAIHPKKLDDRAMNAAWLEELSKFGKFLIKDFENVVQPWQGEKPDFQLARYLDPNGIRLVVRVMGSEEGRNKWIWVNEGTKPHEIHARNARTLAFPSAYSAGSKPGSLFTVRGSSSGDTVFAPSVHHPGTQARNFGGTIAENEKQPFEEWMRAATYRVAQASGHAMNQ